MAPSQKTQGHLMNSTDNIPTQAQSAPDISALNSFAEFYPFYLNEHSNQTCRRLHFVGSSLSLLCLAMLFITGKPQYFLYGLLCGYGFAWIGHFGFEKQTRQFQKTTLQLHGRLGHVQGHLDRQDQVLMTSATLMVGSCICCQSNAVFSV